MNPQLQERVLNWIGNAAEKVGDFATQQIPPFIEEFLTWKFYEALFDIGVSLTVIIAVIGFSFWVIPFGIKKMKEIDVMFVLLPILWSIFTVAVVCNIFPIQQLKTCVQIKVAPKVYLVEYGANLMKK